MLKLRQILCFSLILLLFGASFESPTLNNNTNAFAEKTSNDTSSASSTDTTVSGQELVKAQITIINVQSYPTVGGNWTVRFNTTGTADLIITAVNRTTFGDVLPADLKFLELNNGTHILAPEIIGNSIIYHNYSSTLQGLAISKVLTSGSHHLQFRFGDDIRQANNLASPATFANPTPVTGDNFGASVSTSGNNVLVGALQDDTGAGDAGSAYLFDATTGTLLRTFTNPTPATGDFFGASVSISSNNVLVGAYRDDTGATDTGSAYLFDATNGTLLRTFSNPTPATGDNFGASVSISGTNVLVGAWVDDTGATNSGSAYLFDATTGQLLRTFTNPTPASGDTFGNSVSISENNVLVGANLDDTGATDAGSAYLYSDDIAINDNIVTKVNTPITIDVMANDFHSDSNTKILSITQPNNGHVAPNVGFVTNLGRSGTDESQLQNAFDLTVDVYGNIYVTDFYGNRVKKFDNDGNFLTNFGSANYGNGYLIQPRSVAVDISGNVYVGDNANRIQKFDSSGNFIIMWGSRCVFPSGSECKDPDDSGPLVSGDGQFYDINHIAIDSSGNVYVADTNNNRIQKFILSNPCPIGSNQIIAGVCFVLKWGTYGPGDSQFDSPNGVAVDSSGNVYVADTNNNRIQKFILSNPCPIGSNQIIAGVCFVLEWGTSGADDSQFDSPNGVALDLSGNVYVVDTSNHRIQKFDSSGKFIIKWGSLGHDDNSFYYPGGVTVDSSGNVYTLESANGRIKKFDSSGNFLTSWSNEFYYPKGVATDSSGNLYVADTLNHRIKKYESNGHFQGWIGKCTSGTNCETLNNKTNGFCSDCSGLSQGAGDGQFDSPNGVAVDSSGNVYVADTNNNRIQKFGSLGNFVKKLGGSLCNISSGFGCSDPDDGGPLQNGDGQFWNPLGVGVDSSGNLYVADSFNHRIQKFDGSMIFQGKWGPVVPNNGNIIRPSGVAIDNSGNIYVAEGGNGRILKYNSALTFQGWIGKCTLGSNCDTTNKKTNGFCSDCSGQGYGSEEGKFWDPNGIAVDSSGKIYVADSTNHRIQNFDSGGIFLKRWGTMGSANGQFIYPKGVAVDSSSNVYVADTESHRIQKFEAAKVFYEPKKNTIGDDPFSYTISDAIGVTSTATVSTTVSDAPFIQGIVADDPKLIPVPIYDNNDTITVKFSTATNQPPATTKENLDALFSFSQNLGANYTGEWLTSSTLRIITLNSNGGNPTTGVGGLILTVKQSANLKNSTGTSLASTFTSPSLSGSFDKFTVLVPLVDRVASTLLPSGITTEIKLPPNTPGDVTFKRIILNTTGSGGSTLSFVGTAVDVIPPSNSCQDGCEFSFILDQEDLANAGVTLATLRIFHDKNNDGDVADAGETLVPTIRAASPTGPYTVIVRDTSTSAVVLAGSSAALDIIHNIINNNGSSAVSANFTLTLLANGQPIESFAGSETGTTILLDDGITYKIEDSGHTGYLFQSIIGQDCPDLGESFQLTKGRSITCIITYDDSGITACVLPSSIDWTIITNCTLQSSFAPQGNVIVQSGAVLIIPSNVFLDIKFATKHLIVQSGGGVLIKTGGKIF